MTTKITIRRLMSMVPGNQPVTVKDYITGNTLEDATAEMFVEFIRNDCCVGFDGDYEIYGIQTEGDILVFLVCPQEEKRVMNRCISIDIYNARNPVFAHCASGGISERFCSIYLEHPQGNFEVPEDTPNLCKVVRRKIGMKEYIHLEPVADVPEGNVGYMSGGAYAASSDARFCEISDYPLAIHDRTETQKEYDLLSH